MSMARPKSGKPPKRNLNLTVDENTKMQLDALSKYKQQSISSMVAEWADKEIKAFNLSSSHSEQ